MDWYRLRHSLALLFTLSAQDRAEYIRKHQIFHHMGKNCMVMFRKLPLYPQLISFQDNVWIASNVSFITHDVIHRMLNNKNCTEQFTENIGCIDIRENVFIGANTTILSDVRIGPNVIVGAHSLVNKDIWGGVYAGCPAQYICSIEEFEGKKERSEISRDRRGVSRETEEMCWQEFNLERKNRDTKFRNYCSS